MKIPSNSKEKLATRLPPRDTAELRINLTKILNSEFASPEGGAARKIGSYRCGVYAFYDYDGEPIYVGQTKEGISTRIRRHLTNQRTDAVAMSVLDPFEVYEIEIWPLPQFQKSTAKKKLGVLQHLDALEYAIHQKLIRESKFRAILNEKDPLPSVEKVKIPLSFKDCIVSTEIFDFRSHPDFRIARRALTISRLAQVISERKVKAGLRRVLRTQAQRLQWLAEQRFKALGGELAVKSEGNDEETEDD